MRKSQTLGLGSIGAMMALSGLAAAGTASPEMEYGGADFMPDLHTGGQAPIHRRGRFKQNQRKQRKGLMK